jgi:glycosyltransferase involved in cell wall biosynthesis
LEQKVKFVIVDQSLRDLNGHHFEYDLALAGAAKRMGLSICILSNKDWSVRATAGLADFPVRRYFRDAWNEVHQSQFDRLSRHALGMLPPALRPSLIAAGSRARRMARALRPGAAPTPILPTFGRELTGFFDANGLSAADHVLLHTVSVPELHALIAALGCRDEMPTLHVILRRDASELSVQVSPWGGITRVFEKVRSSAVLRRQFRFYSDTRQLAHQYTAIGGGLAVQTLPIPHNLDATIAAPTISEGRPACVTYLGNARTEKGFHFLPDAVASLHAKYLKTGRLRFVLQANSHLSLEEGVIAAARRKLSIYGSDQVRLINRVLSQTDFQELLLQSDLVLLPYEAACYRRRSSGVLVQALVSGVPVIVPEATWLSDAAPTGTAVTFSSPHTLSAAIATAVDRLPELQAAARLAAPQWRATHNSEALVRALLEPL